MKRLLLTLLILIVLLAAALAIYLAGTSPRSAGGALRFPLTTGQRALLASVPQSADSFGLVPSAASVESKLKANRLTAGALSEWSGDRRMPPAWMIGNADLVAWRSEKRTFLLLKLDPVRAFLARTFYSLTGKGGTGKTQLLFDAPAEVAIPPAELDELLALGSTLPPADAFVVQRQKGRGAFPPIPRPAVSVVSVKPDEISIVSRAPHDNGAAPGPPLQPRLPRSAALTAAFNAPPHSIDDMSRLVAAKVSTLVRDGGAIVLYDVDTDKLLPRPREVIVLPASDARRATLRQFLDETIPQQVREAVGVRVETADTGSELLVAFEKPSVDRYRADTFDSPAVPANRWLVRINPQRAVPMLERISDSPGLRFIAPRLFRSARDLRGWIDHLRDANSIEAGDSVEGSVEELRVKIKG